MANGCQFWKDYDSIGGAVSYCELAAFNRPVNPDFLERIGCTADKRSAMLGGNGAKYRMWAVPTPKAPVSTIRNCLTCVAVATNKASTGAPARSTIPSGRAYIAMERSCLPLSPMISLQSSVMGSPD